MADAKINVASNKLAMSKALGAAFLSHQVEQLEKTVTGNGASYGSGNWRERRFGPARNTTTNGRGQGAPNPPVSPRRSTGPSAARAKEAEQQRKVNTSPTARRRASREKETREKDADIVVVDASVLVHALYKVKKWCKEGRCEIIIVPLEALNTLDMLKKGNTTLAQRARAASRILEAHVGTNPRIRVQRDDAFVPWDSLPVQDVQGANATACPEWVRRIICCAKWESEHVMKELNITEPGDFKVVLAVLSSAPNMSPQATTLRLDNPVPLPAPSLHRHNPAEPRASGSIILEWATCAGIDILEVEPTLPGHGGAANGGGGRQNSAPPEVVKSLVERPPAVGRMTKILEAQASQPVCPNSIRPIRLLARGEKLEPEA